jgi:tetratricopeptide (TPR) repeat protein
VEGPVSKPAVQRAAIDLTALDSLWRDRHLPDTLRKALEQLDEAVQIARATALPPNEDDLLYQLLWRRARASHFQALLAADEKQPAQALAHYEAGAAAAAEAVRMRDLRVEGHFWLGANAAEAANRRGALASLGALRKTSHHIERAMTIDEAYHFAGPLRVWGRITHLKPLLLGGSIERAIDIYRRALQLAPANSTTNLYYAEVLLADQQRPLARQVLHTILNAPVDPDWRWEQTRDRELATLKLRHMDS